MDGLLFARLQFGATTVYHFFFVPVSIGMALFLALMQTAGRLAAGFDGGDPFAGFLPDPIGYPSPAQTPVAAVIVPAF